MAELFHCQQIIIASNDYIGFAGERRREHDVIIFVAIDALTQSCRRDDLGLVMERSQHWQLIRSRLKFVAQRGTQFMHQWLRCDDRVRQYPNSNQVPAEAIRNDSSDEDIRVEDDPHDTVLKTSSSV